MSHEWREQAACVGAKPELFDQDHLRESNETKEQDEAVIHQFCDTCPALAACRSEALAMPTGMQWGIRGGLTQEQRRVLLGVSSAFRDNRRNGTVKPRTANEAIRMDAYRRGLIDRQIAAECGVSVSAIEDWRKRRGLRSNYRRQQVSA